MAWQDYKEESTENLIEYIKWKEDLNYSETAKDAFRAFTYRFQLPLLKKLVPVCINWGYDKQVATEIAYQAFDRVWKYPRYDHTKSKQKEYDNGVLFYLFGISKKLLADHKNFEDGEVSPFTGDEEIIRELPDVDKMNIDIERKAILKEKFDLINKALSRLSPKHKIIYLTYKNYEEELNKGFKMPRKLLQKLRTELDLTQTSIRLYKHEAFNEIDTYLKIYGTK